MYVKIVNFISVYGLAWACAYACLQNSKIAYMAFFDEVNISFNIHIISLLYK